MGPYHRSRGRLALPAIGASCAPDEARGGGQPEAYLLYVEGCPPPRNVAGRAERLSCEARAEWIWRSKLPQWSVAERLADAAEVILDVVDQDALDDLLRRHRRHAGQHRGAPVELRVGE